MRKVLLLTLEYPPMLGGIAEYLAGIFGTLPKEKVQVLTGEKLQWKKRGLPLRWLPSLWHAWKASKEYRSELLVISHVLPMGYVAYLLKRLRHLPYLVIVHGMDLKMARMSRRKRRWTEFILKNAESIAANSEYTRSVVTEFGVSEKKVHVVYPCPSSATDHEPRTDEVDALRDRYRLRNKKVILSVGRLVKRKGFDGIIEVLPRLRRSFAEVVYLIVGTGPEEKALKALAKKKGVQDSIVFAGAVDQKDIPAHYLLGNVFVTIARELPGDVEGFGIVYLEAGRYGLPVVAGKTGGVPEAVLDGKTGLLVDPLAEDEVIRAIYRLLSDSEEAQRLGENGRRRVVNEFNCGRQLERMKTLL